MIYETQNPFRFLASDAINSHYREKGSEKKDGKKEKANKKEDSDEVLFPSFRAPPTISPDIHAYVHYAHIIAFFLKKIFGNSETHTVFLLYIFLVFFNETDHTSHLSPHTGIPT